MKYACIARHRGEFPVRLMCRVLEVSESGFYAAQQREPSERDQRDQALLVQVRAAHRRSRRRYYPRAGCLARWLPGAARRTRAFLLVVRCVPPRSRCASDSQRILTAVRSGWSRI